MTRVGQILVILITCFALLFMGFAVTVFATRTNWREKYVKKDDDLKELTKKKLALEQNLKTLSEDMTREIDNHKKEREAAQAQIKDQQKNYNELLENWKQARGDAAKYAVQVGNYAEETKKRREEVFLLRDQLAKTREQKEEAQKIQFQTQQDHIVLKGSYETLEARAKQLESRQAELVNILESKGLSTDPRDHSDLVIIPPHVEGVILEVDPLGKFVKISIGSDDGLRKLHRLQVYRVKPQGKFVATIEVTEVDPDQAVARILSQFKQGNIQEGDLVATRITASR